MAFKDWPLDRLWACLSTSLILVLFVPVGLFLTYAASQSVERQLTREGRFFAKTLATSVTESLLVNDRVRTNEILAEVVASESRIGYACIADTQSQMIVHTFTDGYPSELLQLWQARHGPVTRFSAGAHTWLDVAEPLLEGQVGTLHIGISRAEAVHASQSVLTALTLVVLCATVLVLVGAYLLGAVVGRPLQRLQTAVSRYPRVTALPPDLEGAGTREVVALAQGFRDMLRRLDRLEKERQATQESLIHTERLAAVGELASGLAHEIRNPLDGMLEFVRFLEADEAKSPMACKYYPMLKDGLERISQTMQSMLMLASSGKSVSPKPCRARDILDELKMLTQPQVRNARVDVSWEKSGPCVCLCDQHGLLQAGLNLVLNAVEAAGDHAAHAQVKVRSFCDDKSVYLTVEDNGPGVEPDLRERIFEPFVSTKPRGKGTGLGLSVSRQLIRAVGGDLTLAEGGSMGGALFVIRLPKHLEECDCHESES